ncbi:hypothetical protein [Chryseobacterium gregarium]|uniref:hypothetical protein n=1 Tax=Chryseobacterium gregarium TaxID=456299 RepID=UPI000401400F|nr:hypothetical protein [Chryseobacterium gregarium]
MKKLLLILGFVCFQSFFAQNIMDLDLKNVELQGMQPVKINKEMKAAGITKVPFVTDNPSVISKIADKEIASKIKKIYCFVYDDPKDNLNDGGVYVYQFNTKKDLDNYLTKNFEQPNYRVLVKDLFYIRIWSDYGYQIEGKETSDDHLNKLEKYYTNLGAKKIRLKQDKSNITVVQ